MKFRAGDTQFVASSDPLASGTTSGTLGATLSAAASHSAESRVPDPRRPDEVEKPTWLAPSSIRAFRGKQVGTRPLNNEQGAVQEPPTGYAWSVGGGGAPTGAPPKHPNDPEAHAGFDPLWNHPSDMLGVGPLMPGNYGSFAPQPTDSQAHEIHGPNDFADPRHTSAYAMTQARYESSDSDQANRQDLPGDTDIPIALYERPPEQFRMGRPARHPSLYLFERPFDQWAAHHLSGNRIRPQSPPDVSGSGIDRRYGPGASMPIRNSDDAPDENDAYPGAHFAPSGMNPTGAQRNTWRLQPMPWDQNLVNI